ncbi:30S ribosome-binding factor RbfA [Flavihumibacter petaseus]|uniref:Ribosome-binding factor A n=1 Tax=Flavihumibacter petaseus NBRC 106054 TaxID=1220578 RepID=A0A0E9MWC5_9BACT|nr:30S ribosome-binding factor RbfA [Flavihumibacter petaseus]GAO41741.1 ribosome-binding factor A [Flavihumibacter petaseus NBRC 106054]
MIQESKRQKQVAGEVQEVLNDIFQRLGLTMIDGGMLSISSVKMTPDLLEARVYISLFQVNDRNAAMKKLEERAWEIKKELAASIKHQVRRIPQLQFYLDETLDHVYKMEEVFRKIKLEDKDQAGTGESDDSINPGA